MKAILIPADEQQQASIVEVGTGFRDLAKAIGGPCEYIERFKGPLTVTYDLVGVCDEDGQFNGQPPNDRAWLVYPVPGYTMRGNVLVMAEGMTPDGVDFIDLPDPERALGMVNLLLKGGMG